MSHIKDRLKQYKDDYSKYGKYDGLYVADALEMLEQLQDDLEQDEKENGWIPVSERLPEEHDSIFAKFKGTNKWSESMFERTSYEVIVTVKYADGTILTETAYTKDGEWKLSHPTFNGIVIAWQSFPNPYKENDNK